MKKSLGPNTHLQPTPVVLVGSYDAQGKANLMTAAWTGVCCGKPPCVYVSLRAATYSHGCIKQSGAYTVGVPGEKLAAQADYCGMASGRDTDKFADLGWTPVASELVHAPYAAQCLLVLECTVVHTAELGLHTMFVGQVMDVKCEESFLIDGKQPDPEKIRPFTYIPIMRHYFGLGEHLGESYQMGGKWGKWA